MKSSDLTTALTNFFQRTEVYFVSEMELIKYDISLDIETLRVFT